MTARRIYVASSWRNSLQPRAVSILRESGHEVYDFRNPQEGNKGFAWEAIDPDWKQWTPEEYRRNLSDPIAEEGFKFDFDAMRWADTFVLVMPCGRSAHLELGWAVGAGKKTLILLSDDEPELMYKLIDRICIDFTELVAELEA